MNFILNLISFLLIVFGLLFLMGLNHNKINEELTKENLTKEQIKKIGIYMARWKFYSFSAIVLGLGIIVARILS